ncbi:MAG: hypothetical protein JW955_14310, partial [Sedimentisphaerales bacterium]|nr:hypothetical protein [Sedimentisphaerales bacterium]
DAHATETPGGGTGGSEIRPYEAGPVKQSQSLDCRSSIADWRRGRTRAKQSQSARVATGVAGLLRARPRVGYHYHGAGRSC